MVFFRCAPLVNILYKGEKTRIQSQQLDDQQQKRHNNKHKEQQNDKHDTESKLKQNIQTCS
jgi:hypothetical protein